MRQNPILRFFKELMDIGFEAFGRYYSKYRGQVTNVNDPMHLSRIKVIIPEVTGNEEHGIWATPTHTFGGKNYGVQVLPKVGDIVWIEFEHGNPEVPMWAHGYFALEEKPKEDEIRDVNNYWFITPGGHRVTLNDTTESIRIESKAGDHIDITKEAISLVTKKKISLGSLDDSEYSSVLGEELKTLLEDMSKLIERIHTSTTKDIAASVLAGQPYLMFTNATQATVQNVADTVKINLQIQKILSNLVKLEK